jgi:hypothetical protein
MAQEIYIYIGQEEFPIWGMSKFSKELYGELNGIPKNFICDLADDLVSTDTAGDGVLYTSCKWDSIKER